MALIQISLEQIWSTTIRLSITTRVADLRYLNYEPRLKLWGAVLKILIDHKF